MIRHADMKSFSVDFDREGKLDRKVLLKEKKPSWRRRECLHRLGISYQLYYVYATKDEASATLRRRDRLTGSLSLCPFGKHRASPSSTQGLGPQMRSSEY